MFKRKRNDKKIVVSYKNDPCKFMENYLLKNLNHKEEENIMTNTNKELSYKIGKVAFNEFQNDNLLERKIEYRAWDINQKKMRKVIGLDFLNDEIEYIDDDGEKTYHFKTTNNNMKLMQYTGSKDKYGKKIFEGDIIKATYMNEDIIGVIIFYKTGYYVKSNYIYYLDYVKQSCEVIGCIYENLDIK